MCQVPSWIKTEDAVLFLTDKDVEAHGIDWKDATGHSAIRKLYPDAGGTEGEGLGKDTPQEVIDALTGGRMNRIAVAGELLIVGGSWDLPLTTVGGGVTVWQGATLTVPALTTVGGYVDVWEGATLTVPALTKVGGSVYVWQGATLTVPALTTVGGGVTVWEGATLTAPKLEGRI
jgi:hypothetical protein